ncbi:MAG: bifunctional N-acetylglucosamine-1-phosphate uridyltransferase/glucosamine-1-phosphate acetyltransferase [Candidatus Aminicenantes bacterium]|nr:bifunctional N-acetylglucosamine-1-phosphate uridyltransferase/glucosamine-1-phosphate acetyltransferase [Candidatus Aminicenantes bacterium]
MKRKAVVLFLGGGPTAFQPVLGRPLGSFALDAACQTGPEAILILGGAEPGKPGAWDSLVASAGTDRPVFLLPAAERKGSRRPGIQGALAAARDILELYPDRDVLAVPAGRPLLQGRTLKTLLRDHQAKGSSLTFLSGGGEIGLTGALVFRAADVFPVLPRGGASTGFETLALRLTKKGKRVGFIECPDGNEALPADDGVALGRAARELQRRKNESLALRGVVFLDPATAWIDWDARIGPRTVVYPSVVIEGPTRIGADSVIFPHVHIRSSVLGARVRVMSSTVMEDTVLETGAQVGPFSRFRPRTRVCAGARVGNFVEMKNTVFGPGSKAQHLSYVGDSAVEKGVNIGAGTITCNYDGMAKNPTRIGAGAFIGSGTELVAPVKVGRGAYVAAGSTITKDVPDGALAIARARQVEKPGWVLDRVRRRKAERGGGKP